MLGYEPTPEVQALFDSALEKFGPLQLSVMSPNVPDLKALEDLEANATNQEGAEMLRSSG